MSHKTVLMPVCVFKYSFITMTRSLEGLAPITHDGEMYHPWVHGEDIQDRARIIGTHIGELLRGQRVRVITILRGGRTFAGLVLPHIVGPAEVKQDSVRVKTYHGTASGEPEWLKRLDTPLEADEVAVLVDDIADSYQTLEVVANELRTGNPEQQVITAVMLNRPDARSAGREDLNPDFAAAEIRDKEAWAIGLGLSIDGPNDTELYGDLPHIYGKEVGGRLPAPATFPKLPALAA
jgi:hypoxanthine phosphoribosyltransferase